MQSIMLYKAVPVLTDFEFSTLLVNKGYDTDEIQDFLTQQGTEACIPPKSNRVV
jgi:hypothetical protein